MREKVAKLETVTEALQKGFERVEKDVRGIGEALARIEVKLDNKASATDSTAVATKIESRPDYWQVVRIVLVIGALVAAAASNGAFRVFNWKAAYTSATAN